MLQEAEKLMARREQDFPNNLLKAVEILSADLKMNGNSSVSYEKLCETLFWLAVYSENKDQKETYLSQGVEQGKKAVKLFPESAGTNFWYAMHLALSSVLKGILKSLFNAPLIRKHGQKALDLDEDYFHGGPMRLIGRSYHKAPAGNLDKSIQLLEKAAEKHPAFLHNQLFLADAYISKGRKIEAKKLLDGIIAGSALQTDEALLGMIRKEATEIRAKI